MYRIKCESKITASFLSKESKKWDSKIIKTSAVPHGVAVRNIRDLAVGDLSSEIL